MSEPETPRPEAPLRCDFCGEPSENVRRVALDAGYDRLQPAHEGRYACPPCSEQKERRRTAQPWSA